jgi:uncharacterized membrane-anchored protein
MSMEDHPQRSMVWRELHARPYVRFSGPAHVFHFAFLVEDESQQSEDANLVRLTDALGLEPTYQSPRHAIFAARLPGLGRLVVVWERHSEFVAYSFFVYELEIPFEPFGLELSKFLPEDFLKMTNAPAMVATRLAIGSKSDFPEPLEGLKALFENHTLNASRVMAGGAEVWSCFRVHGDGFGRIVVIVNEMSPQDLGRTVERLLVIEDSYHLVLISLPLARDVKATVAAWEARMIAEMEALRVADALDKERAVLNSLLGLAADVEDLRARVANQFARSSAYFSILKGRLKELRESKIEHVLRLSRFLMRRLAPAALTHRSVLQRLTNLSERIDRAAELLRTSIELALQEQNKRLLESVDRSVRLQLGLQHAVEGLSVVVLTYYALGIIAHVLHGANDLGWNVHPEIALGIAAPILLLVFWGIIRLIRKGFEHH